MTIDATPMLLALFRGSAWAAIAKRSRQDSMSIGVGTQHATQPDRPCYQDPIDTECESHRPAEGPGAPDNHDGETDRTECSNHKHRPSGIALRSISHIDLTYYSVGRGIPHETAGIAICFKVSVCL